MLRTITIFVALLIFAMAALAQVETPVVKIELIGVVEAIGDGTLMVYGLTVDLSEGEAPDDIAEGDTVVIEGTLASGAIVAEEVKVVEAGWLEEAEVAVEISGPVDAIDDNMVTMGGLSFELESTEGLDEKAYIKIEGHFELIDGVLALIITDGDEADEVADCDNPPPPWAPAKGWRRQCEDAEGAVIGDDNQGNCDDPPPPWAPAKGWRKRCEGGVNPTGGSDSWRDRGNCDNPPPPWAPAKGWRKRCEGGSGSESSD
jgi:hypothetical protein